MLTKKHLQKVRKSLQPYMIPKVIKKGKVKLHLTEYLFDPPTGKLIGGIYLLTDKPDKPK